MRRHRARSESLDFPPAGTDRESFSAPAVRHWYPHPLIPALERTRAGDSARVMVRNGVCHCATPRRQQRWQLPCQSHLLFYFRRLESHRRALTSRGAPKQFVIGRHRGRLHGFCARRRKDHKAGKNCSSRDTLRRKSVPLPRDPNREQGRRLDRTDRGGYGVNP